MSFASFFPLRFIDNRCNGRYLGRIGSVLGFPATGLDKQHLDAAVRAVEEVAVAGHHAKLEKLLQVLDQLLQLSLQVLQAPEVVPGHHHLPDRGRSAHDVAEILHWGG